MYSLLNVEQSVKHFTTEHVGMHESVNAQRKKELSENIIAAFTKYLSGRGHVRPPEQMTEQDWYGSLVKNGRIHEYDDDPLFRSRLFGYAVLGSAAIAPGFPITVSGVR